MPCVCHDRFWSELLPGEETELITQLWILWRTETTCRGMLHRVHTTVLHQGKTNRKYIEKKVSVLIGCSFLLCTFVVCFWKLCSQRIRLRHHWSNCRNWRLQPLWYDLTLFVAIPEFWSFWCPFAAVCDDIARAHAGMKEYVSLVCLYLSTCFSAWNSWHRCCRRVHLPGH